MRAMRDSGVEWIGEVPNYWNLIQAGQLASQIKCPNTGLVEKNLLSLSYGKIIRRDINTKDGLLPESFETYNVIEPDDIVLRFTDLQNDHKSLRVGRATERGIITSAYVTVRPFDASVSRFMYYALHAFDLRKGFYGMGAGVRQGLKWQEAKYIKLPWTNADEQHRIACFLDAKCAEIDCAVTSAQQSIEELKAYKNSIIFEAVTKGLNKDVTMKDSGVEWIGEVPEGWEIHQIKHCFKLISGSGFKVEMQGQQVGTHPVFKASDISANHMKTLYESNNWINIEEANDFKVIPAGSIVMPKTGMALRKNSRAILGIDGCVDNNCQGAVPISMFVRYALYLLCSIDLFKFDNNGTIPFVNNRLFLAYKIALPPLEEQHAIANFLDKKCDEIDNAISSKQAIIDDLKAYKKSLIFEVVTGKVEV